MARSSSASAAVQEMLSWYGDLARMNCLITPQTIFVDDLLTVKDVTEHIFPQCIKKLPDLSKIKIGDDMDGVKETLVKYWQAAIEADKLHELLSAVHVATYLSDQKIPDSIKTLCITRLLMSRDYLFKNGREALRSEFARELPPAVVHQDHWARVLKKHNKILNQKVKALTELVNKTADRVNALPPPPRPAPATHDLVCHSCDTYVSVETDSGTLECPEVHTAMQNMVSLTQATLQQLTSSELVKTVKDMTQRMRAQNHEFDQDHYVKMVHDLHSRFANDVLSTLPTAHLNSTMGAVMLHQRQLAQLTLECIAMAALTNQRPAPTQTSPGDISTVMESISVTLNNHLEEFLHDLKNSRQEPAAPFALLSTIETREGTAFYQAEYPHAPHSTRFKISPNAGPKQFEIKEGGRILSRERVFTGSSERLLAKTIQQIKQCGLIIPQPPASEIIFGAGLTDPLEEGVDNLTVDFVGKNNSVAEKVELWHLLYILLQNKLIPPDTSLRLVLVYTLSDHILADDTKTILVARGLITPQEAPTLSVQTLTSLGNFLYDNGPTKPFVLEHCRSTTNAQ